MDHLFRMDVVYTFQNLVEVFETLLFRNSLIVFPDEIIKIAILAIF